MLAYQEDWKAWRDQRLLLLVRCCSERTNGTSSQTGFRLCTVTIELPTPDSEQLI
jgi:hypothetical protein